LADASVKAVLPALKGTLKANDGYFFTSPVGSFLPNAFGLYDMHGNAEDWCADRYEKDYYAVSPATDPRGPGTGRDRVARGSPWCGPAYCAHSAMRFHGDPDLGGADKGFRAVMVEDGAVAKSAGSRFDGRITVSAETTHALRPLDKEGNVDFLAALNERCRQGVTAENNAAVPFWQALGPSWASGFEEKFFHMMGIDPPPSKGKYLLPLKYYVSSRQDSLPVKRINADYAWDVYAPALARPWSAEEFPILAELIEINDAPLAKFHEAAGRSRYYSPLFPATDCTLLIGTLLPDLQYSREGVRLLGARAMLHLRDRRPEPVWRDLLACHRLARLFGQGPMLVSQLVGRSISRQACKATAVLAARDFVDEKFAVRMLHDLDSLPPMPRTGDVLNLGERYMLLDAVCRMARGGPREFSQVVELISQLNNAAPGTSKTSVALKFPTQWTHNESVDWDLVLASCNRWYDDLVRAGDAPSFSACSERDGALDAALKDLTHKLSANKTAVMVYLGNIPTQAKSFDMFGVMAGLMTPSFIAARTTEYRATAEFQLCRLSLALAIYHRRHGDYPTSLDALTPTILPTVPHDPFSDKGFHYQRKAGTYILYSFGPSNTDEQGRERDSDPPGTNVMLPAPTAADEKNGK
jgi:hypothetical protein